MLVTSLKHGELVFRRLLENPWVCLDTETKPKKTWEGQKDATLIHGRHCIKMWSACYRGESYSFGTDSQNPSWPHYADWSKLFRRLWEERRAKKLPMPLPVMHNGNYDLRVFDDALFPAFSDFWDTMISSWLANGNEDKGLKARAPFYGRYIRDTKTINFDDINELASYAEGDVIVTDEIFQMHTLDKVVRPRFLTHIDANGRLIKKPNTDVTEYELTLETEKLTEFDRLFLKYQEFQVLSATVRCEKNGVPFDQEHLTKVIRPAMQTDMDEIKKRIFRHAGKTFNLNATAQKAAVLQSVGVRLQKQTAKGAFSTDFESLLSVKGQHPIVADMMDYAKVAKLEGTYIGPDGFEHYINPTTRRIHPNLNTVGAVTGRFSCVRGDTLLHTNRGVFRFDDYLPQEGDKVQTHLGRWKPVLRKIYKGVEPMYRVTLTNGCSIVCTAEHRVFSEDCWKRVAELTVGSKVWSYEYIESRHLECRDSAAHAGHLLSQGQADRRTDGGALGHNRPFCEMDSSSQPLASTLQGGESDTLLAQQDGGEEPYAGQEWFPAPQLHRGHRGWKGLPSAQGGREVCKGASARFLCSDGNDFNAQGLRDSSHRRKQEEQQAEQLGSLSRFSSSRAARQEVEVSEIAPVGSAGVWDIEVADDHSYQAQGFLNHNSSNPNLQNVPARNDKYKMRQCFRAPKGRALVCLDFSQIELRVMAMLSKDPLMCKVLNDPNGDIHTETSKNLDVPRDPVAKQCNFLLIFGGGGYALSHRLKLEGHNMTPEEGDEIVGRFDITYPGVKSFRENAFAFHRRNGFIPLLTGRRRVIENIDSSNKYLRHKAETQLANNVVQGSAQDLMKSVIVRCDPLCLNVDKILPTKIDMGKEHRLILADYAVQVEKYRRLFQLARNKWCLQVHDEVLFECDESAAPEVGAAIADIMTWRPMWEPVYDWCVTVKGDGGWGATWSEAKKPKDDAHKIESNAFGKKHAPALAGKPPIKPTSRITTRPKLRIGSHAAPAKQVVVAAKKSPLRILLKSKI